MTIIKHFSKIKSETDNVEITILWQTLKEKNQSLFCLLYSLPTHRSTSVQQENVFTSGIGNIRLDLFLGNVSFISIIDINLAEFWDER